MEGGKRLGESTERTLSLRAEDPLSDINRACAIADARAADLGCPSEKYVVTGFRLDDDDGSK